MVETRETYSMGNFLIRNLTKSNLGAFFDSVGEPKRSISSSISLQDKADDNMALLARSDEPDSTSLQLVHSLFIGKDTSSTTKVIGFLGYSSFEHPVEVSTKTASAIMTGIRRLTTTENQVGSLPTGSDLREVDTARSAAEFVASFDLESMSSEALNEAKKIPSSLLLDSFAIKLVDMEENSTASNLLGQLGVSVPDLEEVGEIDGLVKFLWATAKSCNPVTPTFKTGDWDTATLIRIGALKAKFNKAEQEFYLQQLEAEEEEEEAEEEGGEEYGTGIPTVGDDSEEEEEGDDPEDEEEGDDPEDEEGGEATPFGPHKATKPSSRAMSGARAKSGARARATRKFGSTATPPAGTPPARPRQADLGSDSEDSEDTALSAKSRRLVKRRNTKRRKIEAKAASMRSSQQMEQLIAAAGLIAAATQVQSEDNRIRLERDLLKRSLVKNLTTEQQLMMRLVLGGDFDTVPPQDLNSIKLPDKAAELLKNSNLKLFENKLRQVTEDYQCQPDPGLFGHFISIDGFRKGTNSQTGGLTVFMMHPFSHQETDSERRQRISILIEDATDKEWAEKILSSDYYFPTEVDQALNMLESFLRLIAHISVPGGTVATEGYALGLQLISAYRRQITIRQQDDKLFITKLLHQLDHHDQNFYGELLELMRDQRTKQFPLAHAGPCRVNRKQGIERAFHALRDSLECNFRLPDQLLAAYRKKVAPKKAPTAPHDGSPTPAKPQKKEQPWWTVKPVGDSDAWLLPAGKSFRDFFTDDDRTFLAPLLFPHHQVRKRRPICLRWVSTGKCSSACWSAHVKVNDMKSTEVAAMDAKILSLYGTK
jgi:hypothetical protein